MRVESAFGIHVGNTNACLAVYKDGRSDVVANDDGDRTTPATITYLNGGQEVVVGLSAKNSRFRNAKSTIMKNKRLFLDSTDLSNQKSSDPYAKVIHESKVLKHSIHFEDNSSLKVTPDVIHQQLLKYILDIADSHCDEGSKDAVLTVPVSMSPEKRSLIASAARKAGFNVLQLISEPAAACLAYNLGQTPEQVENVLVFRVGGLGVEATILRQSGGVFSVLGSVLEDTDTGGAAISAAVSHYLANEFKKKYHLDPLESKRSVFKLENAAERVKHVLSTLDTANCYMESLCEGIDFSHNMTRARFNNEISKLMPVLLRPIHGALEKASLAIGKVGKVILAGGSCKIPLVVSSVGNLFPNAEVLNSIAPDEVLAMGGAAQAALLTQPWTEPGNSFNLKALAGNLIFAANGGEQETLIPALTPMPVRRSHHFNSLEGGSTLGVAVSLVNDQGELFEVTKLTLTEVEEDSKISLSAHIYRDGHLHLALTDKKTNKCDQTTFEILS